MITRLYHPSDIPEISRLYFNTVHRVNSRDYSPKQIHAWAPEVYSNQFWRERFKSYLAVVVVESANGIMGFSELEANGHIDCFYVHADHQRQGVGTLLLHGIEKIAHEHSIHNIYLEASITSRPFFQNCGFHEKRQIEKSYRGQLFSQFLMEKNLD